MEKKSEFINFNHVMSVIDTHDSNILIIIKFYCEKVMFIITRSMKIIKRIEKIIIIFFSHVFNSNYIIYIFLYLL